MSIADTDQLLQALQSLGASVSASTRDWEQIWRSYYTLEVASLPNNGNGARSKVDEDQFDIIERIKELRNDLGHVAQIERSDGGTVDLWRVQERIQGLVLHIEDIDKQEQR